MPDAARGRWRDFVEQRLPRAARPDWPVHHDHCFARILLDDTCGGPWRESGRAPAWANLSVNPCDAATDPGETERLGMAVSGRFVHSALPPFHPLQAHLLSRLTAAPFESERSGA